MKVVSNSLSCNSLFSKVETKNMAAHDINCPMRMGTAVLRNAVFPLLTLGSSHYSIGGIT